MLPKIIPTDGLAGKFASGWSLSFAHMPFATFKSSSEIWRLKGAAEGLNERWKLQGFTEL